MDLSPPPTVTIAARTALLVDGENLGVAEAGRILSRSAQAGWPVVRRVYGNARLIKGWADEPGFLFVQTPTGKNAADMAIAVDAMALVQDGVDTLYLASSDGDFTYLALKLRERGVTVNGIGEAKTPDGFRKACARFVVLPESVEEPVLQQAAVVPVVAQRPLAEPALNDLQIIGQALAILQAAGGKLAITELNVRMRARKGFLISAHPLKTWRKFLEAHSKHFDCDPRGPEAAVRLVPTST